MAQMGLSVAGPFKSAAASRILPSASAFPRAIASRCASAARQPFRSPQADRNVRAMSSVRKVIQTAAAPGAVGPYSQAIKLGGTVYVSGQVPLVPGTKSFNSEDVAEQTHQVLQNLKAILEEAGSSLERVLKTTVLLSDMSSFPKVNEVYAIYFPTDPPARACFAVKELPLGAKVEIEAIAAVDE